MEPAMKQFLFWNREQCRCGAAELSKWVVGMALQCYIFAQNGSGVQNGRGLRWPLYTVVGLQFPVISVRLNSQIYKFDGLRRLGWPEVVMLNSFANTTRKDNFLTLWGEDDLSDDVVWNVSKWCSSSFYENWFRQGGLFHGILQYHPLESDIFCRLFFTYLLSWHEVCVG